MAGRSSTPMRRQHWPPRGRAMCWAESCSGCSRKAWSRSLPRRQQCGYTVPRLPSSDPASWPRICRICCRACFAASVVQAHPVKRTYRDLEPLTEPENAMQAMMLKQLGAALEWTDLADRQPGPGEIRVKVAACGVCRTDLHVVDGELPNPTVPIIPGHEIVGRIDAIGPGVEGLRVGERVGIPWVGHTCGVCPYCRS